MNCFYCNAKMEERHELYICDNYITDNLYHLYEVEQANLDNKEFSYYLKHYNTKEHLVFFESEASMLEEPIMRTWKNYFLLEDFDLLKEIKNIEQLELFINKIKIFK